MAAFLETVVRLGAGLPLGRELSLAMPRVRSRFEPANPGGVQPGDTFSEPDAAEAAMGYVPALQDAHPRLSETTPVDQRLLDTDTPLPARSFAGCGENIAPVSEQISSSPAAVPPPAASQPAANLDRSARQHDPLPTHQTLQADIREAKLSDHSAQAQRAHPVAEQRRPESDSPVDETNQDKSQTLAQVGESTRGEFAPANDRRSLERTPEAVYAPERSRPRQESHTVSVSIGRIDVEVAPPPKPPVSVQRTQPERTRGFASYRNARRGRPR